MKRINREKYNSLILQILNSEKNPVSTSFIQRKINLPWHTTLTVLLNLKVDKKVNHVDLGSMHLWSKNEQL